MLNTMVVFAVSGLWHGAEYTFIIWGVFHGLCMIVERMIYGSKMKEISDKVTILNLFRMVVTFGIVSFAWIFFRADNFTDASMFVGKIFTSVGRPFLDVDTMSMAVLALLIVFVKDLVDEYSVRFRLLGSRYKVVRYATAALMVCYILAFGVLNGGSFIYFQF